MTQRISIGGTVQAGNLNIGGTQTFGIPKKPTRIPEKGNYQITIFPVEVTDDPVVYSRECDTFAEAYATAGVLLTRFVGGYIQSIIRMEK